MTPFDVKPTEAQTFFISTFNLDWPELLKTFLPKFYQGFTELLRKFYQGFTKLLRRFFTRGFAKHSKNFARGSVSTLIFFDVKIVTVPKISEGVFQALGSLHLIGNPIKNQKETPGIAISVKRTLIAVFSRLLQ